MPDWIRSCATDDIDPDDLIRIDHGTQAFIIVRSEDDTFHAMDGICSHEKVHLCDGPVMDGAVECPKHNATFDYRSGSFALGMEQRGRDTLHRSCDLAGGGGAGYHP